MIGYYDYTVVATYLATIFGICGIFHAAQNNILASIFCLLLSGFLDSIDGRIARTKKDRSPDQKLFGIQIDSLNDIVCFGLLPAAIGFSLLSQWSTNYHFFYTTTLSFFVLCGLIRLAYFNVLETTRQQVEDGARSTYLGLPITTSSLAVPLMYIIALIIPQAAIPILLIGFLLLGIFYIMPIHIPHPNLLGILVMALIGLFEMVSLVLIAFSLI